MSNHNYELDCLGTQRDHLAYLIKHATLSTKIEEFRELIERYLLVSEAIQQTKKEINHVH